MTGPRNLNNWQTIQRLTAMLRVIVELRRPDLAEADTEVDVLLTWLDSVDEAIVRIIALIDADLHQQDQLQSGNMQRDGNGEPVTIDWPKYP